MPTKRKPNYRALTPEEKKYYKTDKIVRDGVTYTVKYKRSPFESEYRRPSTTIDPATLTPKKRVVKRKKATTTSTAVKTKTLSVTTGSTKRKLALPESCHLSKDAAKNSAEKLRLKGIKARVVSSGKYQCVYTVGKCKSFATTKTAVKKKK